MVDMKLRKSVSDTYLFLKEVCGNEFVLRASYELAVVSTKFGQDTAPFNEEYKPRRALKGECRFNYLIVS